MSRALIGLVALWIVPSLAAAQAVFVTQFPDGMTGGVMGGVTVIPGGPIPPRDVRPPATGTAILRGRVVDASTGTPLRKAIVRISGQEIREMRSASTDVEGRYELKDLPAGRISVSASKSGFVDGTYGQTGPLEPGKTLQLSDRQTVDKIDFALARGSVITGRVLDEYGEPVADVVVNLMRDQFTAAGRRPVTAGRGDTTNDIGEFRLFGLPPGQYYVSATYRQMMNGSSADDRTGYAPTYYPGTPNLSDAQVLTVGSGQNLQDITLMLVPARTARISGVAVDGHGQPVKQGSVTVIVQSGMGFSSTSAGPIRPDGTFVLNGIPPGEYVLRALASPGAPFRPPEFMTATVSVNGEDVDNVRLEPITRITVAGRVVLDPVAERSFKPGAFRFGATPSNPMEQMMMAGPQVPPPPVGDDLTFEFQTYPGSVVVRQMSGESGWMIKRVSLNGVDITDGVTFKGEDMTGLEIELTNRIPEVSGLVTNGQGKPTNQGFAIAFLQDPARWNSPGPGRSAMVRPDDEGRFRFQALRPGDYYIAAVEHLQNGQWMDPEYFEVIRMRATRISIGEGETKTQDLKLIQER